MQVRRTVPNLATGDVERAKAFYRDLLGPTVVMDHGWIVTLAAPGAAVTPQLSIASEGGSRTPVPDLSIEVDDLDAVHARVLTAGLPVEYGPAGEPWGVQRFYVRDPLGRLLNILSHLDERV